MSAGPGPRGGRRRRAGTGQEVGPRAAAEQSATFRVSRQTSRRGGGGGAERSLGGRRGPEVPPCPARAPRLFRPLSSPTGSGARGRGGCGGPGRSRALPAAPASIAAPRALIGLGAATTRGGVPCGTPAPAREGAEGGGPAPHGPAPRRSLAPSHRYPASPRGAARSAVSPNRPCRVGPSGWGGGRGRRGREPQRRSPWGVGAPLSWLRSTEPGHRQSPPGGPAQSWP